MQTSRGTFSSRPATIRSPSAALFVSWRVHASRLSTARTSTTFSRRSSGFQPEPMHLQNRSWSRSQTTAARSADPRINKAENRANIYHLQTSRWRTLRSERRNSTSGPDARFAAGGHRFNAPATVPYASCMSNVWSQTAWKFIGTSQNTCAVIRVPDLAE